MDAVRGPFARNTTLSSASYTTESCFVSSGCSARSLSTIGGGEDTTIPSPGRSPKQSLPEIGLHDSLHGRQACPAFNAFHLGVGQTIPWEGLFSCHPLPKRGQFVTFPPPPQSLNDSKRPDHRMTSYFRVLEITRCESVEKMLRARRLLWAGTFIRMSGGRLPKRIVFGNLEGAVRRGRSGKGKEQTDCVQSNNRALA